MLFFLLLLVYCFHPPPINGSPAAYPCLNGQITIAVDISTGLSAADFKKQIAFLSNQVFTDEWTKLERLVVVPYNQRAFEQTFTADNTAADVRQQLAQLKQARPSNISTLFAVLDSWQQQPAESPVHLLVFVSRIDQAAVDASRPFVRSLQQKNYALTFVAIGGQLDAALFLQLSSNLIPWDVDAQNVPAGWYAAFWTAYGCGDEPTTTTSPTGKSSPIQTSLSPTVSTQTPPAITCHTGTLLVLQDTNGIYLNPAQFWKQIAFVQLALYYRTYGLIENFWWGWYESTRSLYWDFSDRTPEKFSEQVSMFEIGQEYGYHEDAVLVNALNSSELSYFLESTHGPRNLLVFVSNINESIVAECQDSIADLRAQQVRLVLVALNPTLDIELMVNLTGSRNTIQFWDPERQAEPRYFQDWFGYTFGCPPKEAFVPCGDQSGLAINLFFDTNSDTIPSEQIEGIKNFVTNELFNGWTHVERISLDFSCANIGWYYAPGHFMDYADVADEIVYFYDYMMDSCGETGMVGFFTSWVADYFNVESGVGYYNQAYVAFAAGLSEWSVEFMQQDAAYYHGPLTIVALNNETKANATNAGFNVIDWSDPTASAPNDWKNKFWAAFGCDGSSPSSQYDREIPQDERVNGQKAGRFFPRSARLPPVVQNATSFSRFSGPLHPHPQTSRLSAADVHGRKTRIVRK